MITRLTLCLASTALCSCVDSRWNQCADASSLCPTGRVCDLVNNRCSEPSETCINQADGEECTIGSDSGTCTGGICGFGPEPRISAVVPREVFIGRNADVQIIGSNTEWTEDVSVSLGEGIRVNEVAVASPTALLVSITADASAELGSRDMAVDGLTLRAGFKLVSPFRISSVQGVVSQGSISRLRLQNLDFANPFDTTVDPTVPCCEYVNVLATAGEGTSSRALVVEPFTMDLLLFADVDASVGPQPLKVLSGAKGQEVAFDFPDAVDIVPRDPIPLIPGDDPITGSIVQPFQSLIYSITPEDSSILIASASADSFFAIPSITLLPASDFSFEGKITEGPKVVAVIDEVHYLVYWDENGETGYNYQISASTARIGLTLSELESNDEPSEAQVASVTGTLVKDASIPTLGDKDWFQITLAAEDVGDGATLQAITFGSDPFTDTVVTIFQGDTPLNSSDDFEYLDELSVPIEQPGNYFIQITASQNGFYRAEHSAYELAITLSP